jgi:hypothetical protein
MRFRRNLMVRILSATTIVYLCGLQRAREVGCFPLLFSVSSISSSHLLPEWLAHEGSISSRNKKRLPWSLSHREGDGIPFGREAACAVGLSRSIHKFGSEIISPGLSDERATVTELPCRGSFP